MNRNNSMFLPFFIGTIVFLSSFCYVSFAEQKKDVNEQPVTITSQTLTADNKAKTAIFEGSVKAVKGDMILYADKMTVYYQDERARSSIRKIDAEGNIKLVRGERVITSSFARYFSETEDKVVFTGEPRATDGESVITGSRMTYFLKDDRYFVENSKVIMQEKDQRSKKKGSR